MIRRILLAIVFAAVALAQEMPPPELLYTPEQLKRMRMCEATCPCPIGQTMVIFFLYGVSLTVILGPMLRDSVRERLSRWRR